MGEGVQVHVSIRPWPSNPCNPCNPLSRILRLVMSGAFYPNYFVKTSPSELEKRAHIALRGHDPKNTVYLHGFDQEQAKYGELYAEQIKRMFREAASEEQVRLTFDGSRIFVEFDRPLADQERSMASYRAAREDRNFTGDITSQVSGVMPLATVSCKN